MVVCYSLPDVAVPGIAMAGTPAEVIKGINIGVEEN
jgi:hypothetical protein